MKISDLGVKDIVVGLRVKSLTKERFGTVVKIDIDDDHYSWILWDGNDIPYGGFYWNDCECEVVMCFSCEKIPQTHITGLCNECNNIAVNS